MLVSSIFPKWYIDADNPTTVLVIDSVLSVYNQFFDIDDNIDCLISFSEIDFPLCAPKRDNPGQKYDYRIHINCEQYQWAQLIYQLSHEVSHAFMQCYPRIGKFKWISECLCESASLFVLEKSLELWLQPPYNSLTYTLSNNISLPYVISISDYLRNKFVNIADVKSLPDFYIENRQWLADNPNANIGDRRPRNEVFGHAFYKLIKQKPKSWTAVTHMSDETLSDTASTYDYFKHWELQCRTTDEKVFVGSILSRLGL